MDELNNLTTVDTNSRRGGGQPFDIQHDSENQKFTVSEAFYTKEDMNNHGFTAHYNKETDSAYLSIRPNDDAVSYKGREGHTKGDEFKSTTMSELFEKLDLVGNLDLNHVGEKDGITYYRVEPSEDSNDTEEVAEPEASEEIEEEVAVEDTEDVQEEAAHGYAENAVEESTDSF